MNDPITVVDASLPDRWVVSEGQRDEGPVLSVGMVSAIFFARSPAWLRGYEREGIELDGLPVTIPRNSSNARCYRLHTVERVAHGLAIKGVIDARALAATLRAVQAVAHIHGMA